MRFNLIFSVNASLKTVGDKIGLLCSLKILVGSTVR